MKRLILYLTLCAAAFGQKNGEHWVATWTTAQPLIRNQSAQASRGLHNQTVRMIVRTSIAGSKARIKLSNPFGGTPVTIGAAHIALRGKESEIVPGSDKTLTFNGKPDCTIGPGMVILSDVADFAVPAQTDLAVSLFLPDDTGPPSAHNGLHTSYVSKEGDVTAAPAIPDATKAPAYYWLAGLDVLAPANASLIVTLGDSITEGARSTPDANAPWPSVLSARLAASKTTAHFGIANMGIGGNRVLRDGTGGSAIARFDRDVLSQSGVKWVMLLEGINDIGHSNTDPVSAEALIGAFRQMVEQAHTHGLLVMGCTLPPYEGANYYREEGEAMREALNTWIRTSGAFDAVADFEAVTRDPSNPKHIRPEFDPGDHLHPNDAGYKAMADAIQLSLFTAKHAPK